jgi:putative Mg2+ transporter-C (MgtC) family protein
VTYLVKVFGSMGALFVSSTILRLLLAAFLGAVVGLERSFHRKAAGLRTIMLISFGAALFTVISEVLGHMHNADPTRISAQLVTGVGFLGAGSIIHARGSVVGLTTAAIIFVMASIGMACGGGLYSIAIFATLTLLIGLYALSKLEGRLHLKARIMTYTMNTRQIDESVAELNKVLDEEQLAMQHIRFHRLEGGLSTIEFSLDVPEDIEKNFMTRLSGLRSVVDVGHSERSEIE